MIDPADTIAPRPTPPATEAARPRRKHWLIIALVVAALVGAWYGGWYVMGQKTGDDKGKNKAAPIIVTSVVHKDIPVNLTALGTVQAFNTVTVHTRVDGELMALKFVEGQMVHKGDVLAQLDARPFKASRDQAAANVVKDGAVLDEAQRDLVRYRSLGDSIARQTLETQEANVKEAQATLASDKAALESAQTQLDYTTVTSPLDGRTGIRQVDVGNIVHAADTNGIVVITQLEPITVIFSLPQQNLSDINAQVNAGAKLAVDALDGDSKAVIDSGVLELVDNEIDQTTGTIKLKATFPNKAHRLWPGGFANIRLRLSTHANAMVVPTVAVQRGPNGPYVFRYEPEQKQVSVVPVTVGVINGEDAEITDGLVDGDKVVTDGMAKLQDKTKVKLSKSSHAHPADAPKDAPPKADTAPGSNAAPDTKTDMAPDAKPASPADATPDKKLDSGSVNAPASITAPATSTSKATDTPVVHDLSKPRGE